MIRHLRSCVGIRQTGIRCGRDEIHKPSPPPLENKPHTSRFHRIQHHVRPTEGTLAQGGKGRIRGRPEADRQAWPGRATSQDRGDGVEPREYDCACVRAHVASTVIQVEWKMQKYAFAIEVRHHRMACVLRARRTHGRTAELPGRSGLGLRRHCRGGRRGRYRMEEGRSRVSLQPFTAYARCTHEGAVVFTREGSSRAVSLRPTSSTRPYLRIS
jgi:hypothetical protein